MSRFNKSSKYKNAIAKAQKKEFWINDLNVGSNLRPGNDNIKASSEYVAFVHDSTSIGSLAVLPLNAKGRFTTFPLVSGHSGSITDFCFSPFNNQLLATGSDDCTVKLWEIPVSSELTSDMRLTGPVVDLSSHSSVRIENLLFHPSADNVLAISSQNSVKIFDVHTQQCCFSIGGHENVVESISWHGNGKLLSTMCKSGSEKKLQIFDPRAHEECVSAIRCHNGQKHSKALFLSESGNLVTAGFNKMREAELLLWDSSNLNKPIAQQNLGAASSGAPVVLYDGDSKMLFVSVKSENSISFFDCSSSSMTPGQNTYRGSQQTKGLSMVPKKVVDVLSCEIVRLLQLTQNAVIPVSYHVQRKSYSDFHADLYPDTFGEVPAMTSQEWLQGLDATLAKMSMDPTKRHSTPKVNVEKKPQISTSDPKSSTKLPTSVEKRHTVDPQSSSESHLEHSQATAADEASTKNPIKKTLNIVRSSKFRHIEGKFHQKSSFINKIPPLSSTVPGDSNAFQANRDRVAAVLSSSGGQIGVFELKKGGRLDRSSVPTLQNGSCVMDFAFDPFDSQIIVVACEDAKLRLWTIPTNGLSETLTEPEYLIGHQEKANVLQFHPQAKSLLASAGYDCRLILWDVSKRSVALTMDELSQPLFCMAWSPDGNKLATFAKDHVLSIFEPRSRVSPVIRGNGPEGSRGARLVWLEDTVLAISCFNKSSFRTVTLFHTADLDSPLTEITTNVSPAILLPYFDVDTKLLFLTGKGDSSILTFEYASRDPPYLFSVAPFNCASPHQAVAFLPKMLCDVPKVEIDCGVRLTTSSVEGFSIRVPRTRLSYFQDDLYPETLCVEEPALSAREWLQGQNALQRRCSMQPPNMKPLSEAPKEAPAAKKFASYNPEYKSDQQKKEELLSAMIGRMGEKEEDPLPQKDMDGADSDEWSD